MKRESNWDKPVLSDTDCEAQSRASEGFVWATSEQARLRALSLYVIRSIVEKHGGTVDIDLATDTINIDVPKAEEVACAKEIEEQVGSMCF
jgi:hypothetical protein